MDNLAIAQHRLYSQHIAHQSFKRPEDIVQYLGAVQAQDYAGAKWAIGLRLQNCKDAAIDKAMADGSIIRLHVLRPTWHFVVPADVRWMLELTAPRIKAFAAPYHRKLQLDKAIFKQSNDLLAKALDGGKQITRAEIMGTLNHAGIKTNEERFINLLMQAELDQVICSGARQGKQFTYALFDDRVPKGKTINKDEALAALAHRYFVSRGPATLPDFTWWSGLTATDARLALEMIKHDLTSFTNDGAEFWMAKDVPDIATKAPLAYLLPAYDEFAVAYKDRTAAVNPRYLQQARHVIFDPCIVVNKQVVGTWKRVMKKDKAEVSLNLFGKLGKTHEKAVEKAVNRYQKFVKG